MESEEKKGLSWLKDNIVPLFIGLFLLVVVLLGSVLYLILDVKMGNGKLDPSAAGLVEQKSDKGKETVNTASQAADQPSTGPQVQVTTNDPGVSDVINKVFKHVFLPSGEVQLRTIAQPDELRKVNPIFYQFAKQGDYVLIYADRAVLYDPVADRVLDIIHASQK